jgi:hypothetical protein
VARGQDKPYEAEAAMPNGEWPGPNGWAMTLIRAADVEPKPVSWLWDGLRAAKCTLSPGSQEPEKPRLR